MWFTLIAMAVVAAWFCWQFRNIVENEKNLGRNVKNLLTGGTTEAKEPQDVKNRYCPHCGTTLESTGSFCHDCGEKI